MFCEESRGAGSLFVGWRGKKNYFSLITAKVLSTIFPSFLETPISTKIMRSSFSSIWSSPPARVGIRSSSNVPSSSAKSAFHLSSAFSIFWYNSGFFTSIIFWFFMLDPYFIV